MKNRRPSKSPQPQKKISAAKQRWFTIVIILFPFVLFFLLETGLRWFNYGPNLELFTTETIHGITYHVMNPEVKDRYFSRYQFNPTTSPDYFLMPKPQGAFRIFCLGGSTTVGYPYWYNGSFSAFLRDRLRRIFPKKNIEVINIGMTATNSFTVVDMASELVEYEPDLFIVYDGHNEFYGALGVASHESLGGYRWMSKAYLRLIHLRSFMLLKNIITNVAGIFHTSSSPSSGATLMEKLAMGQYIPYNSKTYRDALNIFKSNLQEVRSISSSRHIPTLLASQVSNLRDREPFISNLTDGISKSDQEAFKKNYTAGMKFRMHGVIDSAVVYFHKAIAHDSLRADAHYQLAVCYDSLGQEPQARAEYIKARDYDQLRFRTSTDFNDAIHEAADTGTTFFVDMEKVFRSNSPDSLIGKELIVEHLHPNARGYFLMAKAYAAEMHRRHLLALESEWDARDTVDDEELWDHRSLTELDERIAERRTELLVSGWPFKTQMPIVDAVKESDTLGQIVERVTRGKWNWQQAHQAATEYYAKRGEWEKVAQEYRVLINQIPFDVQPYLVLARLLITRGQIDEAAAWLQKSLLVEKTILAYRALGDIAMKNDDPEKAVMYYEGTFEFPQAPKEKVENGYLLARAYSQSGKTERAIQELVKVLNINPDYQQAVQLMGTMNSQKK